MLDYLAQFFVGALLCNALPHLAAGLQGRCFPTPFATPRGVGHSSPLANVLWGFANLFGGTALAIANPAHDLMRMIVIAVGAVVLGVYLAVHFGRVERSRRAAA